MLTDELHVTTATHATRSTHCEAACLRHGRAGGGVSGHMGQGRRSDLILGLEGVYCTLWIASISIKYNDEWKSVDTFAYEWKDASAQASSSCAWLDALYNQCLSKGAYCSCAGSSSH